MVEMINGLGGKKFFAERSNQDGNGNDIVATYATKTALDGKVEKEDGKGLSTEDYTSADKSKLAGIAAGAQENVIESIEVDGIPQTITNKTVNISIGSQVLPSDANPGMDGTASPGTATTYSRGDHVHPSDISKADIVSNAQSGNLASLNSNGNLADSQYAPTDFATAAQGIKADTAYQLPTNGIPETDLESSVQTSLGLADTAYQLPANGIPSTDLESSVQTSLGLADTAVQPAALNNYVQKETGKGLSTEDYTTAEKTKLAGIETGAQVNVQANWTEDDPSSDAYIQNKPTIPAAQIQSDWGQLDSTALDFIKNKPTSLAIVGGTGITVTEDQANNELVIASTVDITGKADKVSGAVSGNFAGLDSNGNLTDSGSSANSFATAAQGALADTSIQGVSVDGTALTPVSGVVDIDLSGKVDVVSGKGLSTNDYTQADKDIVDQVGDAIPQTASSSNPLVTNTDLQQAIANFGGFEVVPLDPNTHEPDVQGTISDKIIYLTKDSQSTALDPYTEWIYQNSSWEIIGETSVDLNGYIKSVSMAGGSAISPVSGATTIDLPAAANNSGTGTDGIMSGADKVKLDGIATGAEVNTIATISLNGTGLTPDANRNVEITVTSPSPSDANPAMDGTAAAGVSGDYSRADHVHPSDTSKQDVLTFNTAYDPSSNKAATMSDVTGAVAGKADLVTGATSGNLAALDNNGNLVDSQVSPSDFKTVQTAVVDPTASGNAVSFIDTISQDTNGEITVTKKTVPDAVASSSGVGGNAGLLSATDKETIDNLATVATTGNYSDLNNIPASLAIQQGTGITITEANNTVTIATTVDATTKADKVSGATSGNFAGLDSNGNLTDSGSSASNFATAAQGALAATAVQDANYVHTDNNFTTAEQTKLSGIETGAQVNVQSDWTESDNTADSYIQNKPTVSNLVAGSNITIQETASGVEISAASSAQLQADWSESDPTDVTYIQNKPQNLVQDANYVHTDNNFTNAEQGKLSGIETGAQVNVQSDWTESDNTADSYIQNKPTLATVATSGSYNDLSDVPTPVSLVEGQGIDIQEASGQFTISTNFDPSDKADKVTSATNGNLAGLDANGNLTDSGSAPSDFAPANVIPSDATAQNQLVSSNTLTAALADFGGFKVEPGDVTTGEPVLPSGESPSTKIIYLTKDTSVVGSDQYREWIWDEGDSQATPPVAAHWELIGDTSMNLNGYVQFPSSFTPGNIVEFDSNNTISDSGATVSSLENVVETVKVNGTALTPDGNKAVDVTVPITEIQVNSTAVTPVNHVVDITVPAQVNADWNANSGVAEILNKPTLATVATTGDYTDLSNTPTLATVATSGDYDDLTNKPTIPAAQVNADWNSNSGVSEILNKPTLATVATSGDYGDLSNAPTLATVATSGDYDDLSNKPTIPAAQVNSDWNASSGVAEILNKPTIGDGTLSITVGSASAQTFTANQSGNASVTVPLAAVDSSGATTVYTEGLMSSADKAKLEGIEAGAEVNVKPDWNAASGSDAEILNKPTSLAITGGTGITVTEDQVNDELVIACTVDASGKADKVTSATANNFASLTSGGNLADSGYSASSFATAAQGTLADSSIQGVTVDSGSPLTPVSGVVNIDLSGKVDVVSGKGLSTNDYTQADKDVVDNAADVIPSDATDQNQLVSTSTMNAAIADFGGFKVSTGTGADNHPDEANPNTRTVYLVKDASVVGADKYNEWICTNVSGPTWEKIGDTTMDLSGYVEYPSTHVDTHIVAFGPNNTIVDTGSTVASLTNSVETVSIGSGTAISPTSGTTNIVIPLAVNSNGTGSDGAMSGADKVKLDGIATGAEVNTVNTVSIGAGSAISPTSGTTNIVIPLAANSSGTSSDGAMSGADKAKLDGIATGAEVNTVNTVSIGAGSAISPASGTTNIVIPLAVNNSGTGSDGAMSGADKVKLDGIATGAEVNTVNTVSIGAGAAISPTSGTTNVVIPLATNVSGTGSDGAMSGADKVKLDGIAAGAEVNVQADWSETDTTDDAYIANKPDIIIPQDSPAALGGISAPKYLMVVTSMPAAADIDPDTIYLVQGTYIGT